LEFEAFLFLSCSSKASKAARMSAISFGKGRECSVCCK
jgi:hypothetical protein